MQLNVAIAVTGSVVPVTVNVSFVSKVVVAPPAQAAP